VEAMEYEGAFRNPVLIAHYIWGRDPPSLCLLTSNEVIVDVKLKRGVSHSVKVEADVEYSKREALSSIFTALMADVSPLPLEAQIRLKTLEKASSIAYLSTGLHGLLSSLQEYYGESLSASDYEGALAGAIAKAGLTLNQAKALASCVASGNHVLYSEGYGKVQVTLESFPELSFLREVEHTGLGAEPSLSSQLLDVLSKLSSVAIAEIIDALRGSEHKRCATRAFNGVWYIMGAPIGVINEDECDKLVSISLPPWLAVYEIEL